MSAATTSAPILDPGRARLLVGSALVVGATVVAAAVGAVVAGQPLLGLGAVVAAILGLLIMIRPDTASLVVVFLIYSNAAVVAVVFHGVPAFAAAIVPALLTVPLAHALFVRRQPVIITPALPWIIGLLLVQMVGVLFARDSSDAATALIAFLTEGVALYVLVTNAIRTPETLRRVVWTLLLVGALLGGLSAVQEATSNYRTNFLGFAQTESTFATGERTLAGAVRQARQAGPIGEKNRYAQIMLMLVPLGLLQFWSERRLVLRAAGLGAAALAATGTALTFSRGAAVGFVLMLLVMTALRYIRPMQILLVALGIVALLVAIPQYGARVASLEAIAAAFDEDASLSGADNSLISRATTNLAALGVFSDHIIIGVGPGQFSAFYREYAADIGQSVRAQDREAHNLYLGMAADTGILGFTCFMAILFVTLWQLARARRRWLHRRPELANLATGFMLALTTYMTTGLFLHLSYARYFWLMLALAGAAAYIALHLPLEPGERPLRGLLRRPQAVPIRPRA